jgi:tetratricopeptide (TPR) repeat protein
MPYHAALPVLLVMLGLSTIELCAEDDRALAKPVGHQLGAVEGRVLSPKGEPLAGVHVELDQARTAIPVTSTFTQRDGYFALNNIPHGEYEVVAESEDAEVSDVVALEFGRRSLELQFPRDAPARAPEPSTVAVAQLVAPEKARKLREQALEAFRRGHYDDAEKLVQQALAIEPEYADALTLRGLIELGDPDHSRPQQLLEHALRLNPNDSLALPALAAVYNRESRFEEALRLAQRGASLSPTSWQSYLEMAKALIARNECAAGLLVIRKAERAGGTRYAEVHLIKAFGLFGLKLYSDCKYEAQRAIAREPEGPSAQSAKRLLAQLDASATVLAAEQ